MKHTTGEWINGYGKGLTGATTPNCGSPTVDKDRDYIPISIRRETIAIVIQPENDSIEEMNANAQLISASPDMLDALKSLNIIVHGWKRQSKTTVGYRCAIKIENAIKKATGE